jgi:hypothetical protein
VKGGQGIRAVANAVLYEGYLLYPYTAAARKNQYRWQFGVVAPRDSAESYGEKWSLTAHALIETPQTPRCEAVVRFLHAVERVVERYTDDGTFLSVPEMTVDGVDYVSWDEAEEVEVGCTASTAIQVAEAATSDAIRDAAGRLRGRVTRRRRGLAGRVEMSVRPAGDGLHVLSLRIENHSHSDAGSRQDALRSAFLSTHALLVVEDGAFVSLIDPPAHVARAVAALPPHDLWPVLIADDPEDRMSRNVMLASPVILYDYPQIAPESQGDMYDGTEIDELLTLSIAAMSDDEKRLARATDPLARALVDRADHMPREHYERLHGAIRYLQATAGPAGSRQIQVGAARVACGSRVRLRPSRRADVWDAFLHGKTARVTGVYDDVDGKTYVAVSVDDDPAHDLHEWYGRYLYFAPDEIEPLEAGS